MALDLAWYDWVGLLGTAMILGGFALLQAGRLSGTGLVYQLLNLFGAAGVLVSLLGTFIVRSGVLSSVHAFATDPARGSFILGFLAVVVVGSLALYGWRAGHDVARRRAPCPKRLGTRREYIHVG